jgi:hypothetical protein
VHRKAVELCDAKGNVVGAAFARARLDALLEQMPA